MSESVRQATVKQVRGLEVRVRVRAHLVVDGVEFEDGGEDPILLGDLRGHLVRGRGRVRVRVRVRV